ncbi:hypothetical protein EG861_14465, partial [Enterococcus faecalis]
VAHRHKEHGPRPRGVVQRVEARVVGRGPQDAQVRRPPLRGDDGRLAPEPRHLGRQVVADAHLRGLGDAGAAQHQVRVARGLEAHRGHRHGVAAADGQERPDPGQHGAVAARVEGEVGALGHVHQMGRGRLPQGCEGRAEARAAVVAVEVAVEVIV